MTSTTARSPRTRALALLPIATIALTACSGGDDADGSDDPNDALPECGDSYVPPVPIPTPGCAGQPAEVSWLPESGVDYDVEYSADGDTWTDAEHVDAENGVARAEGIGAAGTYVWRIRGIHGDCRTAFSPQVPFEVSPVPDVPAITAEDACVGDPIVVSWTPPAGVDVFVEYEADDGTWHEGTNTGPGQAEIHGLEPGTYDLRATATLGICSESSADADHVTAVVDPDPTVPTNLTNAGPVDSGAPIELSWDGPMTGDYEVVVTAQDGTTWTEMQPGADGTRIEFGFPAGVCVRPGDYTWQVRHITPCGQSEPAEDMFSVLSVGSVTSWTRHDTGLRPANDNSLWGVGDQVWNVGERPADDAFVVMHWDGSTWDSTELPVYYNSVFGTAADDIWLTGTHGPALHFDGSTWTEQGPELHMLWANEPDDVWGLPEQLTATTTHLAHYDGSSWSDVVIDFDTNGWYTYPAVVPMFTGIGDTLYVGVQETVSPSGTRPGTIRNGVWTPFDDPSESILFQDVLALADDAIWWVGGINPGKMVFWNGTDLEREGSFYKVFGVDGTALDNVWAAGEDFDENFLFRRDCEGWQPVELPPDVDDGLFSLEKVWLDVGTDVWASGHEVVIQGHVGP